MSAKLSKRMSSKVGVTVPPEVSITVKFSNKIFTFTTNSLQAKVLAAARVNPPQEGTWAIHHIYLPGLPENTPVTVQWGAQMILETLPKTTATVSGLIRGAYNPGQVLGVFDKLSPLGVRIVSRSSSPTYAKWSMSARENLQQQIDRANLQMAAIQEALTPAGNKKSKK